MLRIYIGIDIDVEIIVGVSVSSGRRYSMSKRSAILNIGPIIRIFFTEFYTIFKIMSALFNKEIKVRNSINATFHNT